MNHMLNFSISKHDYNDQAVMREDPAKRSTDALTDGATPGNLR